MLTSDGALGQPRFEIKGSEIKEMLAGGRGFEPQLTDPESAVLPLDDPPVSQ